MRRIVIILLVTLLALPIWAQGVKEINQDQFKELVGKVEGNQFTINAKRPCIVDFNADWCGPCRKLAPVLKELAGEYTGIDFYSLNIDNNKELAIELGIQSIPMMLFVSVEGQPQATTGFYPKEEIIKVIDYVINGNHATEKETAK